MKVRTARPLWLQLSGHLSMGAALGAALVLLLMVSNTSRVFEMITQSSYPRSTLAVFFTIFVSLFAIGAGLTGWLFIIDERRQS